MMEDAIQTRENTPLNDARQMMRQLLKAGEQRHTEARMNLEAAHRRMQAAEVELKGLTMAMRALEPEDVVESAYEEKSRY